MADNEDGSVTITIDADANPEDAAWLFSEFLPSYVENLRMGQPVAECLEGLNIHVFARTEHPQWLESPTPSMFNFMLVQSWGFEDLYFRDFFGIHSNEDGSPAAGSWWACQATEATKPNQEG